MTHALEVRGLTKTFGDRAVLKQVDFVVEPGQVVGFVGQNGCGKSTFIKIISGVYQPDHGGSMRVDGHEVGLPVVPGSPATLGLVFVHQDLGLFLDGSIVENLRVGRYATGFGWHIKWASERRRVQEALRRVGLDVDPDTRVGELGQVDRALIAIARAVDQARDTPGNGVIVLDEPTSYLPRDGVDKLFAAVHELKTSGMGVIFVSHRIDEVISLCDSITVLREGEVVDLLDAASADEDTVVRSMLGRSLERYYPDARDHELGPVIFSAHDVTGNGIEHVDFEVRRGEILGVTGILGMGQERLLYLLNGSNSADGVITIGDERIDLGAMSPRRGVQVGVALLPADRTRASGVQEATVQENITLATLDKYVRWGRILHHRERADVARSMDVYDVRPRDPERQMRTLSGGNQQKALLAKWLNAAPSLLLLHEPTQGVDVGAKQQIFQQLRDAADAGLSIIIATTEYEDLTGLCDRAIVMRDGRNAAELSGPRLTHDALVEECYKNERTAA